MNIKKINEILNLKAKYAQEKYEDELLRTICGKFVNNYFYTMKGLDFCRSNPSTNYTKPKFDQEALRELQQVGEQVERERKLLAEQAQKSMMTVSAEIDNKALNDQNASQQGHDGIIRGTPEDFERQRRAFRIKSKQPPSIVSQMERARIQQEELFQKKNLEGLAKMRKEYDIYGSQRKPLPPIHSMFRSPPVYEFNDKAIEIEAPTDKRVKISSMSDRMYLHAPSTDEIRNEGMHQTLVKTMDKVNSHKALIERKKLMPVTVREDKLERDFIIYPHFVDFGNVRPGTKYRSEIIVINDNYFLQRVKIIDPLDSKFSITLSKTGPIAMGQERTIYITLDTEGIDQPIDLESEFYILSKYRKYTIEVRAKVGLNVTQTIAHMPQQSNFKPGPGLSESMAKYLNRIEPKEDNRRHAAGDLKNTRISGSLLLLQERAPAPSLRTTCRR